ncbi:hypothetical protein RchiOBHm_Chr3g0490521 [Rosa chinensis]|uniref:Uncharacterized protein n=1 Tax=Rosa chinensis TaxID=74649 RepID=A0A2P6RG07_ROSCH|nr:hypothetical protein RchiOBHm_Chr3g0490521 [Rosa chinensis]
MTYNSMVLAISGVIGLVDFTLSFWFRELDRLCFVELTENQFDVVIIERVFDFFSFFESELSRPFFSFAFVRLGVSFDKGCQ